MPTPSPRRRLCAAGYTLVELLVTVGVVGLGSTLLVPPLLRWSTRWQAEAAAHEVAGALRLARAEALRRGHAVGVRFWTDDGGDITFSLHRDGDGDGLRNRDIAAGIDPPLGRRRPLAQGGSARFGFPPGAAPRDPGDPRRRLDRLTDPIRFNNSEIASFGPIGESTPGSLYLTDGAQALFVVRLFGRTGKVRVLRWDDTADRWHE